MLPKELSEQHLMCVPCPPQLKNCDSLNITDELLLGLTPPEAQFLWNIPASI